VDPTYFPLVAVFGPILGAIIGALFTYFVVVKRKSVRILIGQSEDFTLPLRQRTPHMVFKLNDREMLNLNRARIIARFVRQFQFELEGCDRFIAVVTRQAFATLKPPLKTKN